MIFNRDGTLDCKPTCVLLSEVENEFGNDVALHAHSITCGGSKATITPSSTPVVWVPRAPAVGGEGSVGVAKFEAANLGQFLCPHEDTTVVPVYSKGLARPVFEMEMKAS